MSVKLETKNWQFEITWRELAVTPRATNQTLDEAARFAVPQAASLSRASAVNILRDPTTSWQLVGHSLKERKTK